MKRIGLILMALLSSLPLHAAPDGAHLYQRHCAACHGVSGQGGVGIPLSLPDFLAHASDQYLGTTIRKGRPGRVMPAFQTLSDAQLAAIIRHMRSWQGRPDTERTDTLIVSVGKGDVRRGRELYTKHCALCHGANGEGGKGTGVTFSRPRNLPIMPPALNNVGFLAAVSNEMIKRTLMEGREGTPMMSYLKAGLSEQQIDDIVHYVRSMEQDSIRWDYDREAEPTITMASDYDLDTTVENIQRAAVGVNFRIIRVQHLEDGLFSEDEVNPKQVIIYFCNFNFINQALSIDPRAGLFMPCRITVTEDEAGQVSVMALNPKFMSRIYNNSELDESCNQMHDMYVSIMEEATL